MALKEAICLWRSRGLGPANDINSVALELLALGGKKNRFARTKGIGVKMVVLSRRRSSTSPGATISLHQGFNTLLLKSSIDGSQNLLIGRGYRNVCRAKDANDNDANDDNNGYDSNGFDKNGRDTFGRDKFGLDEEGLDEMGVPGDAVLELPIYQPEYISYIDPNTGEPSPTYGVRSPLPNAAFWGEGLAEIQKNASSSASGERFRKSPISSNEARSTEPEASDQPSPTKRIRAGGKRRKKEKSVEPNQLKSEDLSEEELANIAKLESLKDKFGAEEEEGTSKSIAEVIKGSKVEDKAKEGESSVSGDGEEEKGKPALGELYGSNGFGNRGYALVGTDKSKENGIGKPLTNEELWWNWQKPPPGKERWSAWQKRAGDSDTAMAAAMAETGQIKLFGEKPTIAEATLARARKRVFYNERMEAEAARKKKIGALAYYKEWVKAYKGDTSKEAVQRHFEETSEDEGLQLLDMFAYQTAEEYRIMMGTDVRIRRDPLTMRMREDQIKQVWGGDPVYPTVNYEVDPDAVADYRNENLHEPIPDIIEVLRESGRLITQEELKVMLEQEQIEEEDLEENAFGVYEGLGGAVGIGENDDEDELEADGEETEVQDHSAVQSRLPKPNILSKKSSPDQQVPFELDEVIDTGEVDVVIGVDEVTDDVIDVDVET
ncbi:unnamed protein product [Calypogeia fissa]